MKYLLDTHVFLWALFDSKKLSGKVSGIILNEENDIFVSLVSFWEISLKFNLGKISLKNVLPDELPGYAEKAGLEILGLEPLEVSSFYKLPKYYHKDPFDRLIIWQCIRGGITMISKDGELSQYRDLGLQVVW